MDIKYIQEITQITANIASTIGPIVLVVTLLFTWKQILFSRSQIRELRDTRERQQLYQCMEMLDRFRPDIERVLSLDEKPLCHWSTEEKKSAFYVSSLFHTLGVFLKEGMLPERALCQAWFYSIRRCHEVLGPYMTEIRSKRDSRYWTGFDYLAKRVSIVTEDFTSF